MDLDSDTTAAVSAPPAPGTASQVPHSNLDRILSLAVPVTVILAQRDMEVKAVLELKVGTIIEFDASAESELALEVSGNPIGTGYAVKVGENFGLRVSTIGSVPHRIKAMGRLER